MHEEAEELKCVLASLHAAPPSSESLVPSSGSVQSDGVVWIPVDCLREGAK